MKEQKGTSPARAIKDKLAVVAGGSNKTGRAVAERLAASGAKIIIADINLINAEIVVQWIADKYKIESAAFPWPAEISNVSSVLTAIRENWGAVDIWINIHDLRYDHLVVEPGRNNLKPSLQKSKAALFETCKAVAKQMIAAAAPGLIINIIRVSEPEAITELSDQDNLKKYITAASGRLAEQLRHAGIRLFTLIPGYNQTDESMPQELIIPEDATPDDLATLVHCCVMTRSTMSREQSKR